MFVLEYKLRGKPSQYQAIDEADRRQGKEDLLRQRHRNEDLMRSQKRETRERMGPTPVVASPVEDIVPEGAPISDDDSVVSSVYSVHSEPEGEFRDDLDNHVPGPPPQLLIYMRELGRMSFLRETTSDTNIGGANSGVFIRTKGGFTIVDFNQHNLKLYGTLMTIK